MANLILGALIGGALGSFISASLWRIPRGISLRQPSRCDGCGKAIAPWRNIPVLTWLAQRGKAACCGDKIPAQVVLVEAGGALLGAACGTLLGVMGLAFLTALVLLSVPAASLIFSARSTQKVGQEEVRTKDQPDD